MSEVGSRYFNYPQYEGVELGKSALQDLAEGKNSEAGKVFRSAKNPKSQLIQNFINDIADIKTRESGRTDKSIFKPGVFPTPLLVQALSTVENLRARLKADARPLIETQVSADLGGRLTYSAKVGGKELFTVSGIPANDAAFDLICKDCSPRDVELLNQVRQQYQRQSLREVLQLLRPSLQEQGVEWAEAPERGPQEVLQAMLRELREWGVEEAAAEAQAEGEEGAEELQRMQPFLDLQKGLQEQGVALQDLPELRELLQVMRSTRTLIDNQSKKFKAVAEAIDQLQDQLNGLMEWDRGSGDVPLEVSGHNNGLKRPNLPLPPLPSS